MWSSHVVLEKRMQLVLQKKTAHLVPSVCGIPKTKLAVKISSEAVHLGAVQDDTAFKKSEKKQEEAEGVQHNSVAAEQKKNSNCGVVAGSKTNQYR